jgi:hypothetical protein
VAKRKPTVEEIIREGTLEEEIKRQIDFCNLHLNKDRQRHGGFLYIYGLPEKAKALVAEPIMIGRPTAGKVDKCKDLTLEKATRLLAHPDHLSSWQSRSEARGEYGGAIRYQDGEDAGVIFSFSGLDEQANEAVLVNSLLKLEIITTRKAGKIRDISHNLLINLG